MNRRRPSPRFSVSMPRPLRQSRTITDQTRRCPPEPRASGRYSSTRTGRRPTLKGTLSYVLPHRHVIGAQVRRASLASTSSARPEGEARAPSRPPPSTCPSKSQYQIVPGNRANNGRPLLGIMNIRLTSAHSPEEYFPEQ